MFWLFKKLFPLLFLILGALILKAGVGQIMQPLESSNWPVTPGRVTESRIRAEQSKDSKRQSTMTTLYAQISYNYVVGDVAYSSQKVGFGDYGSTQIDHAQAIVNRYPMGAEIQVRYLASDPKIAVL